jgi:hypothetical protein
MVPFDVKKSSIIREVDHKKDERLVSIISAKKGDLNGPLSFWLC